MKNPFTSSPPPLREVIWGSIQRLKVQQYKVVQAALRLRERDQKLFQTCVNALKSNNKERAAIFANELAEVRKLINFLNQVELAIERVILRLETVRELSDIIIDLKPALETLQQISKQLSEVLPDVSAEINEINNVIGETLYSTRLSSTEVLVPVGKATPEGQQILEEVSSFLEIQLSEKLPEPPATQEAPKVEMKSPVKQMVALAATCSVDDDADHEGFISEDIISFKKAEIQEVSLRVKKSNSLEDALLEYVRKSGGEIDIKRCSRELDVSSDEIERALKSLGAKGIIRIEARR
ncbi:MAG: Snf7 family protein [Candidatus Bathyarchaeia archaeon]